MRYSWIALLISCYLLYPSPELAAQNAPIAVTWEHLGNELKEGKSGHRGRFVIYNKPFTEQPADWAIYFNAQHMEMTSKNKRVTITPLAGDLFVIRPSGKRGKIPYNGSLTINYVGSSPLNKAALRPRGAYYVPTAGANPISFYLNQTRTYLDEEKFYLRGSQDQVKIRNAAERYAENVAIARADPGLGITPAPVHARVLEADSLRLDVQTVLVALPGAGKAAAQLSKYLEPLLGGERKILSSEPAGNYIRLTIDTTLDLPAEGYRLSIRAGRGFATITGRDSAGLYYGLQTLRSFLPPVYPTHESYAIPGYCLLPSLEIEDYPRFGYRGMHLDVARNFQSKEVIFKLLDAMSFYKLNRFHLHLTDDEGWRIAIPGLPELTELGGRRGHTLTESDFLQPSYGSGPYTDVGAGSGHFSGEEFIELLRYAQERHIQVIPEIDLPGHARAAIKSMEARRRRILAAGGSEEEADRYLLSDPLDKSVYRSIQNFPDNVVDVCHESTYTFIEKVVDEIATYYRLAGVPLHTFHVGGDEVPNGVWSALPGCDQLTGGTTDPATIKDRLAAYFLDRVHGILQQRGLRTAGWEEIALRRAARPDGGTAWEVNPDRVNENLLPYVWNSLGSQRDLAYRLANGGYDVIMSNVTHLYFDLAAEPGFDGPAGLSWGGFVDTKKTFSFAPYQVAISQTTDPLGRPFPANPGEEPLTAAGKKHVLGIQGQMWTETIANDHQLLPTIFPKIIALAERAWTPERDWEKSGDLIALRTDYEGFARRVGEQEIPRLHAWGIMPASPKPGILIEDGLLYINSGFPGLRQSVSFYKDKRAMGGAVTGLLRDIGAIPIPAGAERASVIIGLNIFLPTRVIVELR